MNKRRSKIEVLEISAELVVDEGCNAYPYFYAYVYDA